MFWVGVYEDYKNEWKERGFFFLMYEISFNDVLELERVFEEKEEKYILG